MKRLIEFLLATALLVVSLPVMLLIASAIGTSMGRPIIFRQLRPGMHARPFVILKFRTMKECSANGGVQPDSRRLTALGRFLRRTSLDELPELVNIVKGEMSFVGPRPLLMEYLPKYDQRQSRRHDVRPGLTGWAQISGRNELSWTDKLELDVWYVENRSLRLDVLIILKTFKRVISGEGVTQSGHATAPRFRGRDL